MQNQVYKLGKRINYPVPAGQTVADGQVVEIGGLIGVSSESGVGNNGDIVEVYTDGVFSVPLKAGDTPTLGQKLYWDNANGWATVTAGGLMVLGACAIASVAGDASVAAKLIGTVQ